MSEILGNWKQFVNSNFKFEFFTNALYQHLTIWCGFMAHFNREGFYDFYFALNNVDNTFRFVKQFITGKSAELDLSYWVDKNSINREMMAYMTEHFEEVEAYLNSLRFMLLQNSLKDILKRIEPLINNGFVITNNVVSLNKGYEDHILVPLSIMRSAHKVVKQYYDIEYKHYIESVSNDADAVETIKNHIWNDISAIGIWIAQNNIPYEVNNG